MPTIERYETQTGKPSRFGPDTTIAQDVTAMSMEFSDAVDALVDAVFRLGQEVAQRRLDRDMIERAYMGVIDATHSLRLDTADLSALRAKAAEVGA